jgi:hypothetical protein
MSEVSNDTGTRASETRANETRQAEQTQSQGLNDQQRTDLAGRVDAKTTTEAGQVADRVTGGAQDQVVDRGDGTRQVTDTNGATTTQVTGRTPGERPELASLADRIANFQPAPGDPNQDPNQTALRREIDDRYTKAGDVNGAAAMHSALSDVVADPNMPTAQRQELRDYMSNYTKTDPAEIGAMRSAAAGAAMMRAGMRPGGPQARPYEAPSFRERVDTQGRPNGLREMTIGDRTFVVNSNHAYGRPHKSGISPESTGIPRDRIESGLVQSLDRSLQTGTRPPASPSFVDGVVNIDGRNFGYRSTYLPQANEYRIVTYWVQ